MFSDLGEIVVEALGSDGAVVIFAGVLVMIVMITLLAWFMSIIDPEE